MVVVKKKMEIFWEDLQKKMLDFLYTLSRPAVTQAGLILVVVRHFEPRGLHLTLEKYNIKKV